MDEFLLRALAAGIGVAAIAGALGCFLVWRRMAFFGDTLSHSALLGIALGLFLGIDVTLAALLLCAVVTVAFARLQR
ncbi:MAG: metal ABC transporter permease, partial [Pseudomonadales bacterium]|nr:metal ABC transporter permease [Pseudomonadales bacterium]